MPCLQAYLDYMESSRPADKTLSQERKEGKKKRGRVPQDLPPQTKESPKPDRLVLAARVDNVKVSRVGCLSLAACVPGGGHFLCVLSYLGFEKQVSPSNSIPGQKELTTKFHIPVLLLQRLGCRVGRFLLPWDTVDMREGILSLLQRMRGRGDHC